MTVRRTIALAIGPALATAFVVAIVALDGRWDWRLPLITLVLGLGIWVARPPWLAQHLAPPHTLGGSLSHRTDRLDFVFLEARHLDEFAASLEPVGGDGGAPLGDEQLKAFAPPPSIGLWGHFAIVERASGETVAFSSLNDTELAGAWSVGLTVAPSHRGKGHVTEALSGTFDFAHHTGIKHVHIGTAASNVAMHAAITRTGAAFAEARPHQRQDGSMVDSYWFIKTDDGRRIIRDFWSPLGEA